MAVTGHGPTSVTQDGNSESRGLNNTGQGPRVGARQQITQQRHKMSANTHMKLQARGPFLLPGVVTMGPGGSTVQIRDLRDTR